ncbi:MAG: hypothetical protein RMY34_33935 [Aulosira sp. DedQUE10]|nr:hypothetical protein [Aulosira sp. DedQUE10]
MSQTFFLIPLSENSFAIIGKKAYFFAHLYAPYNETASGEV